MRRSSSLPESVFLSSPPYLQADPSVLNQQQYSVHINTPLDPNILMSAIIRGQTRHRPYVCASVGPAYRNVFLSTKQTMNSHVFQHCECSPVASAPCSFPGQLHPPDSEIDAFPAHRIKAASVMSAPVTTASLGHSLRGLVHLTWMNGV